MEKNRSEKGIQRQLLAGLMTFGFLLSAGCAPAGQIATSELPDDETHEEVLPPTQEDLAAEQAIQDLGFEEPGDLTAQSTVAALKSYAYVDPKGLVPDKLLAEALAYFDKNLSKIKNPRYLSVIDFSAHSKNSRLFVIDMNDGSVWALHVAHGSGSDKNHDGFAEKFSNVSGSNASSLGFYMTAETYSGKHGYSLRLDGLSATNSKARSRAIVVHGASYVSDSNVKAGRSWGCPAVSMANRTKLIDKIKGGSLIYAGK